MIYRSLSLFIVIVILVAAGAVLTFYAKGPKQVADSEKPRIAATIYPLYDLTRTVAGENADVVLIVPPGALEHDFEVTPKILSDLSGVQTLFAIGHGLDTKAVSAVRTFTDVSIVTVDRGIDIRENAEQDEGPTDPHYWLNFGNARAIVTTIADVLSERDPAHASDYRKNAEKLNEQLVRDEDELKTALAPYRNKALVVFHDAWFYFAENMGVVIAGAFEPFVAEEPTPRHLAELKKIISEKDIAAIFIEPQISSTGIQGFAEESNLSILTLDPLGGTPGKMTYRELMRYNVSEIIRSFGGEPMP